MEQTTGDPTREGDVLLGRRPTIVDGLIFSPISITQQALDEASPAVPLVLLGEHLMVSQRTRVAVDNVAASVDAVTHLLSTGRSAVAAVGAKRGSTAATAEVRLAGYRRAHREHDLPVDPALEIATRNLKRLSDAGVGIAFGTDTGPPGRFQGYFEHLELELMVKAGLTPMQALTAATGGAARCLKLDRLGTLEPGAWADLLVLARNPLEDIRNTRSLESVWIKGERLAR